MATDSSTPSPLNPDTLDNEVGKRKEGRPLNYWIVLITALISGTMLSVLMILAAIVAAGTGENGYTFALGSMAGACIVLPPLIVKVLEKMWQLDQQYRAND